MINPTQYERYEKLLDYLAGNFIDEITPEQIESICFYSYRNINRIFAALRNETIGQHIKRLRLEKSAEYLRYSSTTAADIAQAVGYADSPSFSKAFKNMFGCAPADYRDKHQLLVTMGNCKNEIIESPITMPYQLRSIEKLRVLYCQYQGSYINKHAMLTLWDELIDFSSKQNLLTDSTLYIGEVLDDETITESIYCRYNAALTLPDNIQVESQGKFKVKSIPSSDYAYFVHHGGHDSCVDTYDRIYAQWMQHVGLEFDDRATLEFYQDNELVDSKDQQVTEIYIPVIVV